MKAAKTTSPTGPTKNSATRRAGFTLMEVMIAVAVLVALTTVTVISLTGTAERRPLNDGMERMGTLVRAIRAEAARKGRRFQLAFEQTLEGPTGSCTFLVRWEPDPLTEPDVWYDYEGGLWQGLGPADLVVVRRCRLTGADAYRLMESDLLAAGEDETACEPMTFYPDGSCDSAEMILASTDPGDDRGAVVTVHGLSGHVETAVVDAEQIEQILQESEKR